MFRNWLRFGFRRGFSIPLAMLGGWGHRRGHGRVVVLFPGRNALRQTSSGKHRLRIPFLFRDGSPYSFGLKGDAPNPSSDRPALSPPVRSSRKAQ